jgi:hypothetical protein
MQFNDLLRTDTQMKEKEEEDEAREQSCKKWGKKTKQKHEGRVGFVGFLFFKAVR